MTNQPKQPELVEDGWFVVRLPAIAEENDPMGRPVGAALWPERFPVDELGKIKRRIFDYPFASLYQQSPQPREGGLFKRDKFHVIANPPDDIVRMCMFFDLALSEKTSADFTVGTLLGQTADDNYVVMDVKRIQKEWDEIPAWIEPILLKTGIAVNYGIEEVFFHGQAVKKLLKRPKLHRYKIKGIKVDKDKISRAAAFADRVSADMVYVLDRVWTQDWLTELCAFPFGANDDQVDSVTGAFNMFDAIKNLVAGFTSMKGKEDQHERNKLQATFR